MMLGTLGSLEHIAHARGSCNMMISIRGHLARVRACAHSQSVFVACACLAHGGLGGGLLHAWGEGSLGLSVMASAADSEGLRAEPEHEEKESEHAPEEEDQGEPEGSQTDGEDSEADAADAAPQPCVLHTGVVLVSGGHIKQKCAVFWWHPKVEDGDGDGPKFLKLSKRDRGFARFVGVPLKEYGFLDVLLQLRNTEVDRLMKLVDNDAPQAMLDRPKIELLDSIPKVITISVPDPQSPDVQHNVQVKSAAADNQCIQIEFKQENLDLLVSGASLPRQRSTPDLKRKRRASDLGAFHVEVDQPNVKYRKTRRMMVCYWYDPEANKFRQHSVTVDYSDVKEKYLENCQEAALECQQFYNTHHVPPP